MAKERFDRSKSHVNVGNIGRSGMNKTMTASLAIAALSMAGGVSPRDRRKYRLDDYSDVEEYEPPTKPQFSKEELEEISKLHGKAKKKRVAELKEKYRNL